MMSGCVTPLASSDVYGQFCRSEAGLPVAVIATLSKGYDLDYIWKQVDRGPAKDAARYYIRAHLSRVTAELAADRRSYRSARSDR
jgi:hypothetical protein